MHIVFVNILEINTFQVFSQGIFSKERYVPKAFWNELVIAESDDTIIVEGNQYFSQESANREYFSDSESHTFCSWKGHASYYIVQVDGEKNPNAAWYYPDPSCAAKPVKDRVAFWHGVKVVR